MSEVRTTASSASEPAVKPGMEKVFTRSPLLGTNTHSLCPGCGEPNAVRVLMESIEEMGERENTVCVLGIGCYTAFAALMDVDCQQAMQTPFWAQQLGKMQLSARQISFRGGELTCLLRGDRVNISGNAVTYLIGDIFV